MTLVLKPDSLGLTLEPEASEPSKELIAQRVALGWERYASAMLEHGRTIRDRHADLMTTAVASVLGRHPQPFHVLYQTGRLTEQEWSDSITWLAIATTKAEAARSVLAVSTERPKPGNVVLS
jgi:hypothetical protein